MKNIMKKIVIVMFLIMTVMMMSGFTYESEEAPVELIEALLEEGFVQDKDDTNIWTIEEYSYDSDDCDYAYLKGWFDTDENIGAVAAFGYDRTGKVVCVETGSVRWDGIAKDWEILCDFHEGF